MKRSAFFRLAAFPLWLLQIPVVAQEGPKEDDFLIFDKIEEDQRAAPSRLSIPRAETEAKSSRPLPAVTKASLRTVLLDVPDKSFATGRLSTLTATATQ